MLFIYYERNNVVGLYHYLIGTKGIKEPLVKEEFQFDHEGYERVYTIKPKYRGVYDIYIQFENFDLNWEEITNICEGDIEIIYISKNRGIKITRIRHFVGYLGSEKKHGDCCGSIYIDQFRYYNDIFRKDIDSIKIKVNKPIQCFPKAKNKKTYLVIRYTYNL
jgi:hypothetical protein